MDEKNDGDFGMEGIFKTGFDQEMLVSMPAEIAAIDEYARYGEEGCSFVVWEKVEFKFWGVVGEGDL
jgi:hypothetical protein